jgi:hypothetical protein
MLNLIDRIAASTPLNASIKKELDEVLERASKTHSLIIKNVKRDVNNDVVIPERELSELLKIFLNMRPDQFYELTINSSIELTVHPTKHETPQASLMSLLRQVLPALHIFYDSFKGEFNDAPTDTELMAVKVKHLVNMINKSI